MRDDERVVEFVTTLLEELKHVPMDDPDANMDLFLALHLTAIERYVDHKIEVNNLSQLQLLDDLRVAHTKAQRYGFDYITERVKRAVEKGDPEPEKSST